MIQKKLPDQPVFTLGYGLVDIGGEVFAYRQDSAQDSADAQGPMPVDPVRNNQAWLIGRSLLGSSRRVHQGSDLVLHLPLGPVAEIRDALPTAALGEVQIDGFFAAPAMLLTSRNGDRMELTTMPNSHTAPWLRGMYNTTPVAWTARPDATTFDNLAPLAIGWWPRYPSAFERDLHPQHSYFNERMRSRSFSWAGFPLRFHDSRFDADASAAVTVLSNGDGMFNLHASALDGRLDWSDARWMTLLGASATPSATPLDASEAFNSIHFITAGDEPLNSRLTTPRDTLRLVDGAELRVLWTYATPSLGSSVGTGEWLQSAGRNGNRAPMLGPVYLRARAPSKVLNVER